MTAGVGSMDYLTDYPLYTQEDREMLADAICDWGENVRSGRHSSYYLKSILHLSDETDHQLDISLPRLKNA